MDFSYSPHSSYFTENDSATMYGHNATYYSTSDLDSSMLLSGVSPFAPAFASGFEVGDMVDPALLDWHQYSGIYQNEATPMEHY